MSAYHLITEGFMPLAGPLNASEKYDAVRNLPGISLGSPWVWGGAIVLLVVVPIVIAAVVFTQRAGRRKRARESFRHQASRLGLSGEEQLLLANLAGLAGIKEPRNVLTIESAFDQAAGSRDAGDGTGQILESLRTKLGFGTSTGPSRHVSVSSRQIPESASLELTFAGRGSFAGGVVVANLPDALAVMMHTPTQCEIGGKVGIRYSNMGAVWEFDTQIVRVIDATILLKHTDEIRFMNRRRFPRIPTTRQACIAAFPFLVTSGRTDAPRFVRATLDEIAGAGLELQAPLEIEVGERALVVVQMDGERVIQGLCRVRRVEASDQEGLNNIAVEMIELSEPEVALLARETNAAAQRRTAEAQTQPAREPAEAPA